MFFKGSLLCIATALVATATTLIPSVQSTGSGSYDYDSNGNVGAAFVSAGSAQSFSNAPIFPGGWIAGPATWVWTAAGYNGENGSPNSPIYRTFRLSFDLTGFVPSTAALAGSVAVDDNVELYLNGNALSGIGAAASYLNAENFSITSGFVAGMNTLDFRVTDIGSWAGLNVGISGTAAVPEPGQYATGALVLAGLVFARFRKGRS
jgi:hypothetical protein